MRDNVLISIINIGFAFLALGDFIEFGRPLQGYYAVALFILCGFMLGAEHEHQLQLERERSAPRARQPLPSPGEILGRAFTEPHD